MAKRSTPSTPGTRRTKPMGGNSTRSTPNPRASTTARARANPNAAFLRSGFPNRRKRAKAIIKKGAARRQARRRARRS